MTLIHTHHHHHYHKQERNSILHRIIVLSYYRIIEMYLQSIVGQFYYYNNVLNNEI
jgi:hypothetical protein